MSALRFDVLTLHPDLLAGVFSTSVLGRAVERGCVAIQVHDLRDWAEGRHRVCDDAPYGGGPGMVLRADVVGRAVDAVRCPEGRVLWMSAAGSSFSQADARRLRGEQQLVLLCGHYEGIDERVASLVDERISLGDFVLTGGEIAAAAVVDAVARLVPGVLGNARSTDEESFSDGLLEYPQYTRPRQWRGQLVPAVLLSGHHERVAAWRRARAEERTKQLRPDLWARYRQRVDDEAGEG